MNYFIVDNGQQAGPYTIDELVKRGLNSDTLVWAEGMTDWTPAWQVEELKNYLYGQQTPPPPPINPAPQYCNKEDYCQSYPQHSCSTTFSLLLWFLRWKNSKTIFMDNRLLRHLLQIQLHNLHMYSQNMSLHQNQHLRNQRRREKVVEQLCCG